MPGASSSLIYEVECQVDPSVAEDFDAWLPGHVQAVTACGGFTGAQIQVPDQAEGVPPIRRTQYHLEGREALERYLREDAPRLRADALQRFGDKVSFTRRVLTPEDIAGRLSAPPARCQNCDAVVTGKYCVECGQSTAVHVLSISDVTHDVVHSALHLDSRVWRTLRSLVLKPGELTRDFIAGRRQRYLPPFRLYLVISLAFFALSTVLIDADLVTVERSATAVEAPNECDIAIGWPSIDAKLAKACRKLEAEKGKRLQGVFQRNAPKLMFLFLPLIAAVAMLFYWRPRRLYAEHLIMFLHVHAFVFMWLIVKSLLDAVARAAQPLAGVLGFMTLLLTAYLAWYVFRAMRVVYGESRARTAVKFVVMGSLYFFLLTVTLVAGIVYSILSL